MRSFKQLIRSRSVRLVVGLAIAVTIPAGALVYVQFRSIRDLETTSAVVLEALGAQTADTLHQTLRTEFERPSFEMERVDHMAVEQLDLARLAAALRERGDSISMVDAFYVWSTRGPRADTVFELSNVKAGPVSERGFMHAGAEGVRLVTLAHEFALSHLQWATSLQTLDGRTQSLVMHLMYDSRARDRLVSFIALRIDLDRFRTVEIPRMLAPMLELATQRTKLATLAVDILDDEGQAVYRSDPGTSLQALEQRSLPLVFYSPGIMPAAEACPGCLRVWTLRVGYREGTPALAARASTTGYRTLLVWLMAVLVLGVILAGRTALKEVQLAEAKSHFVASVSHELKTPLALIQLFAETLELGRVKSAERAREYYAIINSEAKKLAGLINNVLDFSRLESGVKMYQLAPLDLGLVVRGALRSFESQFAHEGFDVRVDIDPDLRHVMGDTDAVRLAVGNLLSNAMKYSGPSRRIDVSVGPTPGGVTVRVRDYGIGISRRHQRRVFDKFYRVQSGVAEAPRGCGLGLAIVHHVMRSHRGRVLIESEPGVGSAFTLVFPVSAEQSRDQKDSRDRRRTPDAAGAA